MKTLKKSVWRFALLAVLALILLAVNANSASADVSYSGYIWYRAPGLGFVMPAPGAVVESWSMYSGSPGPTDTTTSDASGHYTLTPFMAADSIQVSFVNDAGQHCTGALYGPTPGGGNNIILTYWTCQ